MLQNGVGCTTTTEILGLRCSLMGSGMTHLLGSRASAVVPEVVPAVAPVGPATVIPATIAPAAVVPAAAIAPAAVVPAEAPATISPTRVPAAPAAVAPPSGDETAAGDRVDLSRALSGWRCDLGDSGANGLQTRRDARLVGRICGGDGGRGRLSGRHRQEKRCTQCPDGQYQGQRLRDRILR